MLKKELPRGIITRTDNEHAQIEMLDGTYRTVSLNAMPKDAQVGSVVSLGDEITLVFTVMFALSPMSDGSGEVFVHDLDRNELKEMIDSEKYFIISLKKAER